MQTGANMMARWCRYVVMTQGNPMQDGMKYKHKTTCQPHTPARIQGSQLSQDERKYGRLIRKGR